MAQLFYVFTKLIIFIVLKYCIFVIFQDFHCSVHEVFALLGCYTAYVSCLLVFGESLLVPSSIVVITDGTNSLSLLSVTNCQH